MDYNFFLFIKLHDVVFGTSNVEYDIQYEDICNMYNVFQVSPYNRNDEPLYECIIGFLEIYKTIIIVNN